MSSANLLKWKRHRFSRSLKRLKWQGRSSSSGSIYDDWDVTELIPDSFDSIGIEEEDYPEEPSNTSPDGHHMAAAGFSNISFKHEVARKSRMYLIGEKEAEVEVMIDRIIKQQGSKDRALLFVIIQLYTEAKVQKFVTMLLHRGARPIAADAGHQTALHHSVQRNYVGVCQRLLEYNASPTARDSSGVTPYHIAVDNMNDDIASLLLVYTPNHLARQLYCHNGDRPAEFSVQSLLQRPTMQKTMLSLLDCMLEQCGPNNNNHKVYYQALEADSQGRPPNHPLFDRRSVSALHLVAQTDNKDVVYHDVMRLLIRRKWKEYAKIRFQLNAGIYILTVFSLTYAAIVACMADDPINYKGSLHISRALFESIGFGFAVLTFFLELNQIRKNKANYFRDVFNVIDMVSSCLLITVIPLRFVHQGKAQWFVFSFAYITWILRIFKYAAVFRQTGAYAQILWQIVTRDFLQFAAVFAIILLAFSGSYILALKGEGSLATDRDTSSFWWILFSGTRILIEAQPVTDYMENGYGSVTRTRMSRVTHKGAWNSTGPGL